MAPRAKEQTLLFPPDTRFLMCWKMLKLATIVIEVVRTGMALS
jgi:hypothetical protein